MATDTQPQPGTGSAVSDETVRSDQEDQLEQILSKDQAVDQLDTDDLKGTYVRVRVAREAMGEVEQDDIVEWLETSCDDYLGTFAAKLGIDVNPWTDDVVDTLWDLCIADETAEADAHKAARKSLKQTARECVGTADAVVLNRLLSHYV